MATSQFRRSTQTETKKQGGKGPRGNWREQFRLPKAAPTPFVLINGDYTDPAPDPELVEVDLQTGQAKPVKVAYHKWLRHRRKTLSQAKKTRIIDAPCARGWDPHNAKPCAGCAAMDAGDKSITRGETYSIGIIHLVPYHRHPLVDYKTNQYIVKKDNSGPVMVESECLGSKQCNFCRWMSGQPPILQQGEFWPQYKPNELSTVFGSRRYLELGSGHLGNISEWDKQIASRCGGVAYAKAPNGQYLQDAQGNAIPIGRCNNFLDVDGYSCSTCGNLLINAEQDPRPLDQLEAMALKKYPCHHCQRPVFLKENNSCAICGPAIVQGIFDGVLLGQRQGEDQQSHLTLVEFQSFVEFESKMTPEMRQLMGKPLQERMAELAKPYDFEKLYEPKSYEDTAKRLEIQLQQGGGYGPQGGYQQQAPGYPQQAQGYGYPPPQPQQQQFFGQAPTGPVGPPQPGYVPYAQPTGPGPAPFVPPMKPNFGG